MLRRRDAAAGKIFFIDVAAPGYDAPGGPGAALGIGYEAAMRTIHAVERGDGTIITGPSVFQRVYDLVGLGWVYSFMSVPVLRSLAERAYGAWAAALRSALPPGAWLSLETYEEPPTAPPRARLAAVLGAATVFSPNLGELAALVGGGLDPTPAGAVAGAHRLMGALDDGDAASTSLQGVLVRCGPAGAVWVPRHRGGAPGPALAVPAAPVRCVADTTGCGNAFLGGFAASRVLGGSSGGGMGRALAIGAAVAAAVVEVVGPPPGGVGGVLPRPVVEAARARAAWGEARVVEVEDV
jgi:hypothetical protein